MQHIHRQQLGRFEQPVDILQVGNVLAIEADCSYSVHTLQDELPGTHSTAAHLLWQIKCPLECPCLPRNPVQLFLVPPAKVVYIGAGMRRWRTGCPDEHPPRMSTSKVER